MMVWIMECKRLSSIVLRIANVLAQTVGTSPLCKRSSAEPSTKTEQTFVQTWRKKAIIIGSVMQFSPDDRGFSL
jgi:hypothetical protein